MEIRLGRFGCLPWYLGDPGRNYSAAVAFGVAEMPGGVLSDTVSGRAGAFPEKAEEPKVERQKAESTGQKKSTIKNDIFRLTKGEGYANICKLSGRTAGSAQKSLKKLEKSS